MSDTETDTILQAVGAIYQATLNVDEGDEREALQYIQDAAGVIIDEFGWETSAMRLHPRTVRRHPDD